MHHHTRGTIHLKVKAWEDIPSEIKCQLDLGLGSLPTESKFLLEIPVDDLFQMHTEKQQYWLYAIKIKAARMAAQRALAATDGATNSWNVIKKRNDMDHLPTFNPVLDVPTEAQPTISQTNAPPSKVVITA